MDKLLVFIKGANDSYANLASNVVGMYSNTAGEIVVKFKSQDGGGVVDSVALDVTSGKENDMVEKISGNIASARAGKIIVADSIKQKGIEPNIVRGVSSISLSEAAAATDTIEIITASKSLQSNDSGKTFLLSKVGGFVVTLPASNAINAGWKCKFIVATPSTGASYRFDVDGNSIPLLVHATERLFPTNGNTHSSFYLENGSTTEFRNGVNAKGDAAEVIYDGTQFIFAANVKSSGAVVGS